MRIVVIGSDSFIAKKYIDFVHDKGDSIVGISRVGSFATNELFISDFYSIPETVFQSADVIINFSAIVHRPDIKDESIYDDVNYRLTVLNAQKAKKAGVGLFIQMSTIAVYGSVNTIDINMPCNPFNPYGSSKFKADLELLRLPDENFKVAIVRPPMIYGGGKAPGNMMRLIKLVDRGIPLPFKGIENKRDFIHVNNLVQYLSIIIQKQLNGVFIVSDKEPISTEYLVQSISKSLGKKDSLIKVPSFILELLKYIRPKEYNKLFGTLRLENNFPYEDLIQRFSVEQGIREMVEWYKARSKK